jgi:iron complex outermembrane receptor protein
MSIEELMRVRVTTVAGTEQSRISSPAALYVITAEDIRRSGHRSIAEALRLVPGMYVGRINSSSWVVGARGLTGTALSSTRYLVLVDGRVVHDPLVSTTFWDVVDVMLEDIDRIEVIRGPGATLWGQNAMNGVINIITRSARETQGTLAILAAGDHGEDTVALRHGEALGEDSAWRAWAKYSRHGDFVGPTGGSVRDQWSDLRGGFRFDAESATGTVYTLQSDAYTHPVAMASVRLPVPDRHLQFVQETGNDAVSGANVIARAQNGVGTPQGWSAQATFDRTLRDTSRYGFDRNIESVDLRRWTMLGERNQIVYGVAGTHYEDHVDSGPVLLLDPESRSWNLVNGFVQDTMEWSPGRWYTMVGTKLSHHDFVGFYAQPSVRVWWTPSETQTWWAAVSRPERVPSRFEENGLLAFSYVDTGLIRGRPATGVIVPLGVAGDDSLKTEKLTAYELGHRIRFGDTLTVETAAFFNDYTRIIAAPPGIFGTFTEAGDGETFGADVSVSWRPFEHWRLEGSYSWLRTQIHGPVYTIEEGSTPERLGQLRSNFDLGENVELNGAVYYVDSIPRMDHDAYTRVDLGVTWRPAPHVELALWGQNLFDGRHLEASGAQVPRTVYVQASFDFGR